MTSHSSSPILLVVPKLAQPVLRNLRQAESLARYLTSGLQQDRQAQEKKPSMWRGWLAGDYP